jgi:integrase
MILYRRGKHKLWHYDFTQDGFRHQGSTHTANKDDAEKIVAAVRADLIRGKFDIPRKSARFDLAAEKYLEYARTNKASESTEKYHVAKHLNPHFGEVPVNSINLEFCERFKRKRLDAGASKGTINRELTTFKSVVRYAGDCKMAREGLGRYARLFTHVQSKEKRVLTQTQLEQLYAACQFPEIRVRASYLGDLILLLVYSGLRPSEALGLRWSDVDFSARSIRTQKSKTRAGIRSIPMHEVTVEALQRLREDTESEWVFPSHRKPGDHIRDFGKAFEKAVQLSGIPRVSPYSLRHTFFSWMDSALTRRSILREIGGHSRDHHTDAYLHPNWTEKRAAIDRLPIPANFTTSALTQQSHTNTEVIEIPKIQGLEMVGPCGLEPQTSTVSRCRS